VAGPIETISPAARLSGRAGAILLLLGLLTGAYVSAAMTGRVPVDPRIALSAHLNAILGAFFIFGVGWTLPMLRYGPVGQGRLLWTVVGANYANWVVTAVKAWLHVSGVAFTGNGRNDAVFAVLTASVVVPSLAAAVAWIAGFAKQA
jgi:(hydroxyamino)benzene mutase